MTPYRIANGGPNRAYPATASPSRGSGYSGSAPAPAARTAARWRALDIHLDTAIAGDANDRLFRQRHLHAKRSRKAEPHGSQTTRVDPAPRFIERIIESGEHLMLTDVGRYVRIAVSQPPDRFNNRLRFNLAALRVVLQAVTRAPLFNLLPPVANFISGCCVSSCSSSSSICSSTGRASPTIGTSAGTVLDIEVGSISICSTVAFGQ